MGVIMRQRRTSRTRVKTIVARHGKKAFREWGRKGGNPYLKKGYKFK